MTDLMFKSEIQDLIRDTYRHLSDDRPARLLQTYRDEDLALLPGEAVAWSFGTDDPVSAAELQPGEHVVDLGCGAGIDAILAAHRVGPEGQVTGVDLLPEMCRRARRHAAAAGLPNVTFVEGEIEALPLPDASADVVVSNGVISLSARKARVFREALRVLRPGGRICVSDMTLEEEQLPQEVMLHPAAWAG
ncbi:MAG: methyltransferase domain-containing protein [Actinobacteria bacterium]|nr:methyltransferase domain-containing protein [Actinomycetota bacterium]